MDFYLGQVMLWAMNWAPQGWMVCAGQSLPVNQYQALYSLIGNAYGGDQVNFNLPDMRGRVPVSSGQGTGLANNYQWGKKYGVENMPITISNLPSHNHSGSVNVSAAGSFQVSANGATSAVPGTNSVLAAGTTDAVDGNSGPATVNIYGTPNNMITLDNALKLSVSGGGSFTTNNTGTGVPVSIIQPTLAMTWAICVSGIYPPRP